MDGDIIPFSSVCRGNWVLVQIQPRMELEVVVDGKISFQRLSASLEPLHFRFQMRTNEASFRHETPSIHRRKPFSRFARSWGKKKNQSRRDCISSVYIFFNERIRGGRGKIIIPFEASERRCFIFHGQTNRYRRRAWWAGIDRNHDFFFSLSLFFTISSVSREKKERKRIGREKSRRSEDGLVVFARHLLRVTSVCP